MEEQTEVTPQVVDAAPGEVVVDYTDPETEITIAGRSFQLVYNLGAIKKFAIMTKYNLLEKGLTASLITDPDNLTKLLMVGLEARHGKEVNEEFVNNNIHMKNWTYVMSRVKVALDIIQPRPRVTKTPFV